MNHILISKISIFIENGHFKWTVQGYETERPRSLTMLEGLFIKMTVHFLVNVHFSFQDRPHSQTTNFQSPRFSNLTLIDRPLLSMTVHF